MIKKAELPNRFPVQMPARWPPNPRRNWRESSEYESRRYHVKVPGMGSGSNAYLGIVRRAISNLFNAPPVGNGLDKPLLSPSGFKLHRNGTVTDVTIEDSSGNE